MIQEAVKVVLLDDEGTVLDEAEGVRIYDGQNHQYFRVEFSRPIACRDGESIEVLALEDAPKSKKGGQSMVRPAFR